MRIKDQLVLLAIAVVSMTLTACGRAGGPASSPSNSSAQQSAVINDLRKLVETQCGTNAEEIDPDKPIETQGCDELDVLELVMTVEEKYNLTISDEQTERVTINKLARIINR